MSKKGQGAVEYLLIIAAAVIIAIVVIAILFYNEPVSCFVPDLGCAEWECTEYKQIGWEYKENYQTCYEEDYNYEANFGFYVGSSNKDACSGYLHVFSVDEKPDVKRIEEKDGVECLKAEYEFEPLCIDVGREFDCEYIGRSDLNSCWESFDDCSYRYIRKVNCLVGRKPIMKCVEEQLVRIVKDSERVLGE